MEAPGSWTLDQPGVQSGMHWKVVSVWRSCKWTCTWRDRSWSYGVRSTSYMGLYLVTLSLKMLVSGVLFVPCPKSVLYPTFSVACPKAFISSFSPALPRVRPIIDHGSLRDLLFSRRFLEKPTFPWPDFPLVKTSPYPVLALILTHHSPPLSGNGGNVKTRKRETSEGTPHPVR